MTQQSNDAPSPEQLKALAEMDARQKEYERLRSIAEAARRREEVIAKPITELLDVVGLPTRVHVNAPHTSINANTGSSARYSGGKQFTVSIAQDASMLDVLRIAATEMFHTNVAIIDTVTSNLNKPDVGFIAKAIETSRVELLGDVWFGAKMAQDTKGKLANRNDEQVSRGMPANYNSHIGGAVEKVIYDLDGQIDNPKVRNAMERFSKEIRAATMSMDSTAAINVAVDIAHYLEIEGEEGEEEPDGPGTTPGDGEGNGGSGDDPGDGDKPKDEGNNQPGNHSSGGEVPKTNHADDTNGTESPTNQLTEEAPPQVEKVSPEELKKRLNRNLRAGVTRRENKSKSSGSLEGTPQPLQNNVPLGQSKLYYDRHNAMRVTVQSVPTPLSETVKFALKQYADSHSLHEHQLHKRGMPSRSAWKLNYGNMRVFEQPPKTKGHVSILIDISSSMGCWCVDCNAVAFGVEPDANKRYYRLGRASNAFLAWQVSAALGKLHPTAEVFAFSSPSHNIGGDMQSAIYPLPSGHQPAACGHTSEHIVCGGTPTCTAMLWFKEHLSQRASDTTAIVITDGQPNGCGPSESHHVEHIGAEMLSSGMQFGTVFIGNGKYLSLPTEVSVNIGSVSDLRNIQPLLELLDS